MDTEETSEEALKLLSSTLAQFEHRLWKSFTSQGIVISIRSRDFLENVIQIDLPGLHIDEGTLGDVMALMRADWPDMPKVDGRILDRRQFLANGVPGWRLVNALLRQSIEFKVNGYIRDCR